MGIIGGVKIGNGIGIVNLNIFVFIEFMLKVGIFGLFFLFVIFFFGK